MTHAENRCPVCFTEGCLSPYGQRAWEFEEATYNLINCKFCYSIFTSPSPSDQTLENLYRTSFDFRWYQDHFEAKLRDCRIRIKEYRSLLGVKVLDFGGGVGYFSQAAREIGLKSVTYDPYINSTFPEGSKWDSVVALHVLEHSNNLTRTLEAIKSLLVPGGRLIIAVPNAEGLGYKNLGMSWVWAQPPLVHIFHFTAIGLKELLARHGFEDIKASYHERWDANLYCDLERVEEFSKWDADWGRLPFKSFRPYRRWIARRNTRLRFQGLQKSLDNNYASNNNNYSELQITATLKAQ